MIKHSVEHLLQPSLYFKPILSLADYIHQLSQSVHPKSGKKSSSLAVLPGFTEMNYLFPSVLLKYFYFLHSGYTWNSNAVLDMLSVGARAILVNMTDSTTGAYTNDTYDSHWQSSGAIDGSDMIYCASIFREVICLILFNRRVAQMNITMQTVLNLLTGEWKFQSTKSVSVNKGTKLSVTSATASRIAGLKGNSLMSQDNDDTMSVAGHIHRSSSQELNTIDHSGVGGRMAGVFNYSTNKNGIQTSNLFHTEQYLWSLLMCPDHMFISSLVPSKDDISECLKYYRRLLTASQWKRITSTQKSFLENFTGFKLSSSQHQVEEFEPDVNELFSIISILGIVCRAIILSYNVYLKTNTNTTSNGLSNGTIQPNILTIKHLKLGELLEYLPPGSKSDIANQLLESLEFSGNIWKNKFDPIWFQTNQISYSSYSSTLSSVALTQLLSHSNNKRNSQNLNMTADNRNSSHAVGLMNTSTTFKPSQLARFFKQNYLFIDTPIIPLVTFFKIISEKLPMPYPPEQTLTRMFPNVATTASST